MIAAVGLKVAQDLLAAIRELTKEVRGLREDINRKDTA